MVGLARADLEGVSQRSQTRHKQKQRLGVVTVNSQGIRRKAKRLAAEEVLALVVAKASLPADLEGLHNHQSPRRRHRQRQRRWRRQRNHPLPPVFSVRGEGSVLEAEDSVQEEALALQEDLAPVEALVVVGQER